ncbi:IQ calmodulin-binding motif [Plasmodiophora brassicae]|uniref:Uncharacterized protein n=1 Tax=Plasmodiophora brassicae TaxID=37360 RepID=A0A0G4IX18_PLABS|nr:hypothetical protein PBRA_007609 [Plasmodiophora brassicae]SPR02035.1 unnamed protein product [Plasmodiophora brassicae]
MSLAIVGRSLLTAPPKKANANRKVVVDVIAPQPVPLATAVLPELSDDLAAIRVQRAWRRYQEAQASARVPVRAISNSRIRLLAARIVQDTWRRIRQRRLHAALRDAFVLPAVAQAVHNSERDAAALTIQRSWRGAIVRHDLAWTRRTIAELVSDLVGDVEDDGAARQVQSAWRAHADRRSERLLDTPATSVVDYALDVAVQEMDDAFALRKVLRSVAADRHDADVVERLLCDLVEHALGVGETPRIVAPETTPTPDSGAEDETPVEMPGKSPTITGDPTPKRKRRGGGVLRSLKRLLSCGGSSSIVP